MVIIPTETVYGLAVDALNSRAVSAVFAAKGRPLSDPLIVHVSGIAMARALGQLSAAAVRAAERYWPGPFTMVVNKRDVVPGIVTAENPTVALRMPDHAVTHEIIATAGVPVAAPSANRFGSLSPTSVDAAMEQLPGIPAVDGGPCLVGIESTVVSFVDEAPAILRPGAITKETLEADFGITAVARGRGKSPGQAPRHYAPRTPLRWYEPDVKPAADAGRLTLVPGTPGEAHGGWGAVRCLSENGDLREAASKLFAALRELDSKGLSVIWVDRPPSEGLGEALNDRLHRAMEEPE
jgi:L-threonylcarbamoyladenylate synthase